MRWVPTAAPPRGLLAVGSQHVDVDASQHPLVLAEAVGLPADIAATQRAEVAEAGAHQEQEGGRRVEAGRELHDQQGEQGEQREPEA